MRAVTAVALLFSVLTAGPACQKDGQATILVITARLSPGAGTPAGAVKLRVTVAEQANEATQDLPSRDNHSLTFPTTFSLELPKSIVGPVRIQVSALSATGQIVASGL